MKPKFQYTKSKHETKSHLTSVGMAFHIMVLLRPVPVPKNKLPHIVKRIVNYLMPSANTLDRIEIQKWLQRPTLPTSMKSAPDMVSALENSNIVNPVLLIKSSFTVQLTVFRRQQTHWPPKAKMPTIRTMMITKLTKATKCTPKWMKKPAPACQWERVAIVLKLSCRRGSLCQQRQIPTKFRRVQQNRSAWLPFAPPPFAVK